MVARDKPKILKFTLLQPITTFFKEFNNSNLFVMLRFPLFFDTKSYVGPVAQLVRAVDS